MVREAGPRWPFTTNTIMKISIADTDNIKKAADSAGVDLSPLNYRGMDRRGRQMVRVRLLPRNPAQRRRSPLSGRHVNGVTWALHRDFFDHLFRLDPDARAETTLAIYNGRQEFLSKYPSTYHHNAGSRANPASFGQA